MGQREGDLFNIHKQYDGALRLPWALYHAYFYDYKNGKTREENPRKHSNTNEINLLPTSFGIWLKSYHFFGGGAGPGENEKMQYFSLTFIWVRFIRNLFIFSAFFFISSHSFLSFFSLIFVCVSDLIFNLMEILWNPLIGSCKKERKKLSHVLDGK